MGRAYDIRNGPPPVEVEIEPGVTLLELTDRFNPEGHGWQFPTVCLVDNAPVLRKDWARPLSADSCVSFVQLPEGGGNNGSNPLKMLLTIVLTIITQGVYGWVSEAIGGVLGMVVGGLAAGAVMMLGSLLLGAIFKGPSLPSGQIGPANNEQASPTYGLNASNNQARLYQPIPESFGRIMIVPDRAAQAYSQYISNEMYLFQVFSLGRGIYDVEAMAFGDSVFWKRDEGVDSAYEVEVQFCQPGEPVTLFPDNVEGSIEVSGQQLLSTKNEEFKGPLGPFSANPPGTRTNRIVCNFTFPQGLGRYSDSGSLHEITVSIRGELRRIDDNGDPLGEWTVLFDEDYKYGTLTAQRFSVDKEVPEGRYQIRVQRTDENVGDGRLLDHATWESLFCFLPGTLSYPISTVALIIKATNILSQQAANTFTVTYTRKLPEYDIATRTWSEPKPTRKFAAALSSVLNCSWGGNLPYTRIDLDTLWGVIDPILEQKGWTFDGYFDGSYTVFSLVLEMCQAFRVVPRVTNGGVTFIYDRPGRPPRHVFTPLNVMRGSVSVSYGTFTDDTPDNINWNYLDEDAGFQEREVTAALPDSETRNPVLKSFIGCVNRRQAFQMGMFAVACNRHRRISVRFSVEAVGNILLIGDICTFNHPFFSNVENGNVKSADEETLTIELDSPTAFAQKGTLYLALETPNGTPWGPCRIASVDGQKATLDAGDYAVLIAQGQLNPFDFIARGRRNGYPVPWTLQTGKEFSGRVIIQSVVPSDTNHYEITAINDSDEVDNYENMPVPPWDYRGQSTDPTNDVPTAPRGFSSTVKTSGESATIGLTWLPVQGAASYYVEIKGPGATEFTRYDSYTVNFATIRTTRGHVQVRVRAINYFGTEGPWGNWESDIDTLLEAPVPFTIVKAEGGESEITWNNPPSENNVSGATFVFTAYEITVLRPDGESVLRMASVPAFQDEHTYFFQYTKEMAFADGGPYRDIKISLKLQMIKTLDIITGPVETAPYVLDIIDPAPIFANDGEFNVTSNSVLMLSAEVDGEYTGFIMLRGNDDDFGTEGISEIRYTNTLPYEWTGLSPETTYYFRVAPKDAFSDLTGKYFDLNFSPVLQALTGGA
jgi:hypothetical protein